MTLKRFWSWILVLIGLAASIGYIYMAYQIAVDMDNRAVYVLWATLGLGCGYFLSRGVDMLGDNPRKKK